VIVVEQPLIGPWPPDDADRDYHNYNIQLLDGNRIDLSFVRVTELEDLLSDSLTKVLLDKDKRIPPIPPPDERSYFISEPTCDLYNGCCTGFFFALGSHIPKTIWRKKLPLLKVFIEAWLRQTVTMMLEWEIGIRTGWDQSIGSGGKYLESRLEPDVWETYRKTYVGSCYDEIWDSLFVFLGVFKRSAKFVADEYDFSFPQETANKVQSFLEHVRTMTADEDRIY
jgi:aminoglycoside 6-adenylyltransferase